MGTNRVFNDYRNTIESETDVDALLHTIEELSSSQVAGELSREERYQLQYLIFEEIRDQTLNNPLLAEPIIFNQLLPFCILKDEEAGIWLSRHRVCLGHWLEQYSEDTYKKLRGDVLEAILPHLSSQAPEPACWTISVIGYRDDKTVEALWNLVDNDSGQSGDVALAVITFLGVELDTEFRQTLLSELHRRILDHYDRYLCSAITNLADPAALSAVYESWLAPGNYSFDSFEMLSILAAYRDVLDQLDENHVIQDHIWKQLKNFADSRPEEFSKEIFRKDLVASCNSPLVIPDLCSWISEYAETTDNPASWRWITGLTMEDCIKPRQLSGWNSLDSGNLVFERYQEDACQNTGNDTFSTSSEDRQKRTAWGMLLRAGYTKALDWFNEGVGAETGRFMQATIMDMFACFKCVPLPELVKRLITEPYDEVSAASDARELSRRLSAMNVAQSASSNEAFDVLLDFGLNLEGKALRQSSIALSEVAIDLVRHGDRDIEAKLIDTIVQRMYPHQSEAAAFALEHVVPFDGSSLVKQADRLYPLLTDETREEYERSAILTAISRLPNWDVPVDLLSSIENWAKEPNRWLGGASLELLANEGMLHENESLLISSLGLVRIDNKWDLAKSKNYSEWTPYFLGLLYQRDRKSFLPAILSLIRNEFWFPDQLARWLKIIHGSPQESPPLEIANALVQRVYDRQSSTYSEPEIFDLLLELAPEALTGESWEKVWGNWLQSARVGLANALGKIRTSVDLQENAIRLLQQLCLDSHYAVRRSSYRGLAMLSPVTLYADCLSWVDSEVIELVDRAAEAFGWIDFSGDEFSQETQNLQDRLQSHREKTVRETAKRTIKERSHRKWASDYEHIVKEVRGETDSEVANAWRYGEALAKIGDDSSIDGLRDHLRNSLPPNVRFWLNRIIKDLEKNWQTTTEKWPDAWFRWKGSVEQGDGIIIAGEKEVRVRYSLWQKRASIRDELDSWGGAVWPVPFTELRKIKKIRLANGAEGKISPTRISNDLLVFLGNGHYPISADELLHA